MERFAFTISLLVLSSGLLGLSSISSAKEGEWTKKADMPTARCTFHSTSTVNGKIYVFGGGKNVDSVLGIVEEYDPMTDRWKKKADMPTARAWLSTSVVNNKVYAIGGLGGFSTVEEYDPATDTWTKKADMPTARGNHSTSALNGKIYVIGGLGMDQVAISSVEEYDPETDKWAKKTDIPTARGGLSTSAVNGKIYAIGGQMGGWGPAGGAIVSTVEEYDPVKDTWAKKANMPTARVQLSTSEVNGKIYAIGGNGELWFAKVEEYDPTTNTWISKADMLTARAAHSTSSVNGKIYVIGGTSNWPIVPLSTVEEYDTGFVPEEIWAQKTDTASYESRIGMFTFTLLFKFKPGTDVAEIQRLFSETMMQALPAVPGLISFKVYKYEGWSQNATVAWQETTEWEWVFVETWDSKESYDKASMGKVLGPDGSVARSGFYEKFSSAIEKSFGFYATATK